MYSRGTSTKTRIETLYLLQPDTLDDLIQEAHPLKQGLKQNTGGT